MKRQFGKNQRIAERDRGTPRVVNLQVLVDGRMRRFQELIRLRCWIPFLIDEFAETIENEFEARRRGPAFVRTQQCPDVQNFEAYGKTEGVLMIGDFGFVEHCSSLGGIKSSHQ